MHPVTRELYMYLLEEFGELAKEMIGRTSVNTERDQFDRGRAYMCLSVHDWKPEMENKADESETEGSGT